MCIKFAEVFQSIPIKAIIADEVHFLKNVSTKRTTNLTPLLRQSQILILLTGTPALAKPKELFTIVHLLRPDVFTNFYEFGARYCNPKPSMWRKGLDFEGASFIRELHFLLTTNFMIRRLKKDVLTQLPPKTRQKIPISVDHKILQEINALLKSVGVKNIDHLINDLLDRGYLTHFERNEMLDKAEKDSKSRLPFNSYDFYILFFTF
jgi:SWI/SNF-related matrix-associated actin-dependent regulator 1 of chromatin subfamily A